MKKDNINTVCHRWLKEQIKPHWIALDATAGNGNDTLFLCCHCHHVYALDIQKQAETNTLFRCQDFNNLCFYLIGHQFLDHVIHEQLDCAVFNFGYLPGSDQTCITQPETSVKAVQLAFDKIRSGGILMLSCYLGHDGGQAEHEALLAWINSCTNIQWRTYRQSDSKPILYEIKKNTT